MKKIKLRMWTGKEMVYRGIYDKNWYYHPTESKLFRGIKQSDHIFPLMLNTGLKDNKGFDIYEFDIIKTPNNSKFIVVYQAPEFIKKQKLTSKRWSTFIIHPNENQFEKVIGNFYENPELLETK